MFTERVSRRRFLKTAIWGLGASTLAACAAPPTPTPEKAPTAVTGAEPTAATAPQPTQAPAAEVIITTSGWPVNRMPTAEEIEADKAQAGFAKALQAWLDQNPGVKIERLEVNIWDAQAIIPAISGGTAPTFLYAAAMGNWSLQSARNVFVQGLVADVTPFITKYGIQQKSLPEMWAVWNEKTPVNGKYWAFPINEAGLRGSFIYRKDLVDELGLKRPTATWTWDDARELFRGLTSEAENRKGFGAPTWMVGYRMDMHGFGLLTQVPAPGTGWNWTRDYSDPRWPELIKQWRDMLFAEKTVLSDVALGGGDDEYFKLFHAGQIACGRFNIWTLFGRPEEETSIAAMADRLGKPYEKVAGLAAMPWGDGYYIAGASCEGGCSFSPDSSQEVLDKACSLLEWFFWGEGRTINKVATYEATQDLKAVYNSPLSMDGKITAFEGVPGTFTDAWGEEILDEIMAVARLPVEPEIALYFPAEQNPAPNNQPIDDKYSKFVTDPSQFDIAADLKEAQEQWNAQASGFTSSISDADFVAGAKAYYAEMDAFLKKNLPDFYENRFKPFYEGKVLPALG
ncbi:MAG: extracellular solute-binding protein [Anaerolineae bacterium]|nr:extracellular solute-binding protein [Anaerolineae bacterium]